MNWTEAHQKKYNWLKNHIAKTKEIDSDLFILHNLKDLRDIIQDNHKWGKSAKEGLFFMIARWLSLNKPELGKEIKNFKQLGYGLHLEINAKEMENKLSPKEKQSFKSLEYYCKILEQSNTKEVDRIGHFKRLLLAMLVLQPPLRTSFYTDAKVIRSKIHNNGSDNFVYVNNRGTTKKAEYIVNKDKVSEYKLWKISPNKAYINVDNKELIDMLVDSIRKYPRKYLFEIDSKPVSQSQILYWLRQITKSEYITINNMRSIYISHYHKDSSLSQKAELAKKMRHTENTAMKNYFKLGDEENKDKDQIISELRKKITELELEIHKLRETTKEVDIKWKKKRSDLVYRIKKGHKPKFDTVKKYNLEDLVNE